MDRWRVSLFGDRLHVIVDEDAEAAFGGLPVGSKRAAFA